MTGKVDVPQITATARSVNQLLSNSRYGLEFYQREYSWEEAQVTELIEDLAGRFRDQYNPNDSRQEVASYRPYFLGPIVTTQRNGVRYLVDGQQRITTLSLLLIYLQHCLKAQGLMDAQALNLLIFSMSFGRKTFNLDVPERKECLSAILYGKDFNSQREPQSVRNLWDRYETIKDRFPSDLQEKDRLPYFSDWLQHRVILVEISALDQDMALEIFETMNDRGLRLNNIDMLKSFLLSKVGDECTIRKLNDRWRRRVTELTDTEKNADAEFVKAWLRGKYAMTQRERKPQASPGDFEIIGTAFHKWVRDNGSKFNLGNSTEYQRFVEEFFRHSERYLQLLKACQKFNHDLEFVYYNAQTGLTLQLPVILASITPDDDDRTFYKKTNLVAAALDIFVVRRMVNFANFGYSTVVYMMFNLIKEIRDLPLNELSSVLAQWLEKEGNRFDAICSKPFGLTQRNRKHIHYILARITAWLDSELGKNARFSDYMDRLQEDSFEIEHIWANHFYQHSVEFKSEAEFQEYRNRFGGLLLLQKSFNRSYGDKRYEDKLEHYNAQNPLARSLHPLAYQNNPMFSSLCEKYELKFKPCKNDFTKVAIDERQKLYQSLAEIVWNPARLRQI